MNAKIGAKLLAEAERHRLNKLMRIRQQSIRETPTRKIVVPPTEPTNEQKQAIHREAALHAAAANGERWAIEWLASEREMRRRQEAAARKEAKTRNSLAPSRAWEKAWRAPLAPTRAQAEADLLEQAKQRTRSLKRKIEAIEYKEGRRAKAASALKQAFSTIHLDLGILPIHQRKSRSSRLPIDRDAPCTLTPEQARELLLASFKEFKI